MLNKTGVCQSLRPLRGQLPLHMGAGALSDFFAKIAAARPRTRDADAIRKCGAVAFPLARLRHAPIEISSAILRYPPHPLPPLCKGRCRAQRGGGIDCRSAFTVNAQMIRRYQSLRPLRGQLPLHKGANALSGFSTKIAAAHPRHKAVEAIRKCGANHPHAKPRPALHGISSAAPRFLPVPCLAASRAD